MAPIASYQATVLGDAPLLYYRLDDTGCCVAADISGNARNGTYPGSGITYSVSGLLAGDADKAIGSDGSGAAVSRDASFLPSTGARTMEIWEKTTSGNNLALISYGQTNANTQYFQLSIRGGNQLVFIGWGDDASFATPYPVNDGRPHHIVLSYATQVVTFYLDGQQIGQAGLPAALSTSLAAQPLEIGGGADGGFPGVLDEVAIYGTDLTPAQVNTHWRAGTAAAACPAAPAAGYAGAVAGDHPLRYFRLGDAGQAATDFSGNCQYAAYNPGDSRVPGLLAGDPDGAVSSPTPAGPALSVSTAGLPTTGPRTLELWESTTSSNNQALFSYGRTDANTHYFQLGIRNNGSALTFIGWGDDASFNTPYPINDGHPHQVALAYDGSGVVTFLLDGQQIGQSGIPAALDTWVGAQGLEIGSGADGAFTGTLDEVAVYPVVLGADRLNAHWRLGSGGAPCPSAVPPGYATAVLNDNPFRYFRFGDPAGQVATDFSGSCHYAAYAPGDPRMPGLLTGDKDGAVGSPTPPTTIVSASADGLPATGARTVEIWESTTSSNNQALFSYGQTNANTHYFQFSIRNNGTALTFIGWGDDASFNTPYPINDGNPHHVALTYNGTGVVTFYLDGQQIGQSGLPAALDTWVGAQALEIGNGADGLFTGTLDEAAFYQAALTPAQVNAHWRAGAAAAACTPAAPAGYATAVVADQPLRYFRLGDSGQAATDFSGSCRYGAYAPGDAHAPGLLTGDPNLAVGGPSPLTTIVSASADGLPTTGPRTVELWEQTSGTNNQALLSYGQTNANTHYFQLSIRPSGGSTYLVFIGWGDDAAFITPYPINDGHPHHVALSYDGVGVVTFFVDGQQIGRSGIPAALDTWLGAQGLEIGNGADGLFTGLLQEVAVYSTEVSPAELNAHWRAGSAAPACQASTSPYAAAVGTDHPFRYFRLGDAGMPAVDYSGNCHDAAYAPGDPRVGGLLTADQDGAVASPSPPTTIVSASADGLPTNGPRTVELWESTTATNNQALVSYGQTNANTHYFQLSIRNNGNQLVFIGWGDDAAFATPYPINDGNPHHVALSYDGTGVVTFYLDGQQIGRSGIPAALDTWIGAQALELGNGSDGLFSGVLDEVAFYNSEVSPAELNAHWRAGTAAVACPTAATSGYPGSVAADNPLRYFRVGEVIGQVATDSSGSCRYAAYAPAAPRVPGLIPGDSDGAVANPVPPGAMVSASTDGLPGTGPRTFEVWEQTTSANNQALLSYGQTNANTHYFQVSIRNNGTALVFIGWGDDAAFNTPYPVNDGKPHQVAVTYDGHSLMTFYLDGLLIGEAGLPAALDTWLGAQALEIGNGADGPFIGTLDEPSVYGTALGGDRIASHYIAAQQNGTQGIIIGNVTDDAGGIVVGVAGAAVSATTCTAPGVGCTTVSTTSGVGGTFRFTGLAFGTYQLAAFPGPNSGPAVLRPGYANATVTAGAALAVANIKMTVVVSSSLPPNVTFNGNGGMPTLFWGSPTTVNVSGCPNGIGFIVFTAVNQSSGRVDSKAVPLFETPPGSGKYAATVPPFYPDHGSASGQVNLQCPDPTAVLPGDGPATGGTTVRISGTGLSGTQAVSFGGSPAQSFQVVSDKLLLAVAPPGSGTVQISLTGPYGTIACNPLLTFTYLSVTGVTPTTGTVPAGGLKGVTITGTGFTHMAGVYFGAVKAASAIALSDNEIIASVPTVGTGTVDVRVVTAGGASPATSADLYNFDAPANSGSSTLPAPNPPPTQCPPPASAAVVSWDPASILAMNSAVPPPAFGGNSTVAAPDPFWSSLVGAAAGGVYQVIDGASAISDALNNCDGSDHQSTLACALTYYGQIQGFWDVAQQGQEAFNDKQFIAAIVKYKAALDAGDAERASAALGDLIQVEKFAATLEKVAAVFEVLDKFNAAFTPFTLAALFDDKHLGPFVESKLGLPPGSASLIAGLIGGGYGAAVILLGPFCPPCDIALAGIALGLFLYDSGAVSRIGSWLNDFFKSHGWGTPFGFMIDPSGNVLTTAGAPVAGATVNLLAGPTASGPFNPLSANSGLLVPAVNPETTDGGGNFHWDVAPGFYEVSASAPGCSASTSSEFPIPPPATGIVVTLSCPGAPGPAPPTVTGLSSTRGTATGGDVLTISGTGFTPGATVSFGAHPASSVTFVSPNALQVVAPAGTGTVDVVVGTAGGASATSAADQFSYSSVPAVGAVAPSGGLITGGTLVDVRGSNFTPTSAVLFGDQTSPYVTYVSPNELQALSPQHAEGTVDVMVRNEGGTSPAVTADHFAYRPLVLSPTLSTTPQPATAVVGGVLNDAAVLTGGSSPGGTVTFKLYGPSDPTCSGAPAYTETDAVSGAAASTGAGFASNATGTWNWTASYSGDANNTIAASVCGAEPVTVTRATPTLATSASPPSAVVGGALNDTAMIGGGLAPGGSVLFALFAPGDTSCVTPVAMESDAVVGGAASSTLGFASNVVGTWQWTAAYSGDANNNPVATACGAEPVTVSKASPTLGTTPSVAVVVGGSLTDSATLGGGYRPGGSVTFALFGPGDPACAATPAYTETDPVASGAAATATAFASNAAGTWHWTAAYSGDAANNPAASGCAAEPVSVLKATPSLTTTATTQAFLNDPVTDTAHLGGGYHPTGGLSFLLFGPGDTTCANPLAPAPGSASAAGAGDYVSGAVAPAQVGWYRWLAAYSGDANNNAAGTGCGDAGESTLVVRHSYLTDEDSCLLGARLGLEFSPHGSGSFKLRGTAPSQVFYETVDAGAALGGTTLTISLPYPWVTRGRLPVEIYDGVTTTTDDGRTCLEPGKRIGTSSGQVALANYGGSFGTTAALSVVLPQLPNLKFVFVRVRLDYGLRGETGCTQSAPGNDAACMSPAAVTIPDGAAYTFSDTGFNQTTIQSQNIFTKGDDSDSNLSG